VDDEENQRLGLASMISSWGFHTATAADGMEALEKWREYDPHVLLTDMMMPRLGGFPVLEFLKTLDAPPPVIMITANEGGRHKAYAEMLGVADYLRKPFPMEALLESVRRIFAGKSESPAPAKKGARKRTTKSDDDE